jgi:hypothetical protein
MVFLQEHFFGIVVIGYRSDRAQELDIIPGKIDLIIEETTPGAGREQVVVIMPFSGHKTWPDLVDRHVFAIEIGTVFAFVLSFAVSFIVEGTYAYRPKTRCPKKGAHQGGSSDQIEYGTPESPVQEPANNFATRVYNGRPLFVLFVAVGFDRSMAEQPLDTGIIRFVEVPGNGLVVDIGQKTIEKTGRRIIGVSRLVRFGVMDVVGDGIQLFRHYVDRQVACNKTPEFIAEPVGIVGTLAVIPDRTMGPHDDHAVQESHPQ